MDDVLVTRIQQGLVRTGGCPKEWGYATADESVGSGNSLNDNMGDSDSFGDIATAQYARRQQARHPTAIAVTPKGA